VGKHYCKQNITVSTIVLKKGMSCKKKRIDFIIEKSLKQKQAMF